jgi:flagellar biosynthetic protein FliR
MTIEMQVQLFLLALVRTTAAFVSVPGFNERGIPAPMRIAMAALLAFITRPAAVAAFPSALGWGELAAATVSEIAVGLFIGLVIATLFEAVSLACRCVETQAGFSLGSSIFGASSGASGALGAWYHALVLLLFFTTGADRLVIRGLASTFSTLPLGTLAGPPRPDFLISAGSHMFVAALHFGAPVVGGILLADVALGLLARSAPQLNVFAVGFAVKVSVALALSLASLAVFAAVFARELHAILLRLFGGA